MRIQFRRTTLVPAHYISPRRNKANNVLYTFGLLLLFPKSPEKQKREMFPKKSSCSLFGVSHFPSLRKKRDLYLSSLLNSERETARKIHQNESNGFQHAHKSCSPRPLWQRTSAAKCAPLNYTQCSPRLVSKACLRTLLKHREASLFVRWRGERERRG